MRGYRAALRIARREAWRSKGRSALVVAMIGVPMLGLAFADVAARTGDVPGTEEARRQIGTADLLAEAVSGEPIVQQGIWSYGFKDGNGGPSPLAERDPDVAAALPAGSRVVVWREYYGVRIAADGHAVMGQVEQMDAADPLARGKVSLRDGAFPRAAGETALTPRLARDLDAGVGDTVTVGTRTFRVTGIAIERASLSSMAAYVPPSADVDEGIAPDAGRRWAVDLPPGADDVATVAPLNALGVRVMPRTWFTDPPPDPYASSSPIDAEALGVGVVAVGLATLEIVLLAGTAFAVGARRKRRELALVAATGGDRRDVRRIVLAEGVVLGAVAGLVGVAGGIAAVFFGRPLLERVSGSLMGPLDLRPLELGAIVAVGAVTALLATLLPARSASRQPVVSALTGRRGDVRTRKRVPVVALVAVVAGALLAFWAAGTGRSPMRDDAGAYVAGTGRAASFNLVLAGAVLSELGFVACAPALVGLVGRLASRLPLSLRLAVRDAARHRTRSGPAVAAVVAAVAGSVALSVYVASDTDRQRREYQASLPMGYVTIGHGDPAKPVPGADVDAAVRALPAAARYDVGDIGSPCDGSKPECTWWNTDTPRAYRCDAETPNGCVSRYGPRPAGLAVADPEFVEVWTGHADPVVAKAMAEGSAVVFDERWLQDGRLVLRGDTSRVDGSGHRERVLSLPAVVAKPPSDDYGSIPSAILTPATVARYGLPHVTTRTVVRTSRLPTGREEAAARHALLRNTTFTDLYVERGFQREAALVLLALVGGAAFVTMAST
ncbi:MAG TPA: FtsX-like permease family protein, partial [Frankiaceae bacterium]|nr:FtsX-like permease family protein [Frankiaceae bacterium]